MKLTRRIFLGTAAGGVLAVGVVGAATLAPLPRAQGLKALSDGEMRTARALCDAVFPKDVLGVSADEARVAEQLDGYIGAMFDRERHLIRLMLRLLEQRARFDGSGKFSSLPADQRVALLQRWEATPDVWGLGVGAVRLLAAMFYFQDERVQRAVGWGLGCDVTRGDQGEPT